MKEKNGSQVRSVREMGSQIPIGNGGGWLGGDKKK